MTVGFAVATAVCVIVVAMMVASILSELIVDESSRSVAAQQQHLIVLVIALLLRTALSFGRERYSRRASDLVIAGLRSDALDAVTDVRRTSPRQLVEVRGHAATVLLTGLDDLGPYLSGYVPALILSIVVTPLTAIAIAVADLPSAIIVAVTLPLIPVFMVLIGLMTADRTAAKLAATSRLSAQLLDLVAGIPTLTALHRIRRPARQVVELGERWRRSTMATLRIAFLSGAVLELLATLCVALVAVGIGVRLVYGEISLFAGVFALVLAPEVYLPLRQIGAQFHNSADGLAAADEVFALIDDADRGQASGGAVAVDVRGADIDFTGVSVEGRDGPAPNGLVAHIPGGSLTVWRGSNGSGKSTALSVLLGLSAPDTGSVSVGGTPLDDIDLDGLRKQIAWLPQSPVILPGTVIENLRLFGDVSQEAVENACVATGFDTVVAELGSGLDTPLGSGGVGISAGQRQRLGLTRVLASPAPLLLLDEPTAHLDAESAAHVIDAIRQRVTLGATAIVVSHRETWWAAADHIVDFGVNVDA